MKYFVAIVESLDDSDQVNALIKKLENLLDGAE
jgi:hypothetical protein